MEQVHFVLAGFSKKKRLNPCPPLEKGELKGDSFSVDFLRKSGSHGASPLRAARSRNLCPNIQVAERSRGPGF